MTRCGDFRRTGHRAKAIITNMAPACTLVVPKIPQAGRGVDCALPVNPGVLNLGSGNVDYVCGDGTRALNIDSCVAPRVCRDKVDLVADLMEGIPMSIADESVDLIVATALPSPFLRYLPLINSMDRVLRPGGEILLHSNVAVGWKFAEDVEPLNIFSKVEVRNSGHVVWAQKREARKMLSGSVPALGATTSR